MKTISLIFYFLLLHLTTFAQWSAGLKSGLTIPNLQGNTEQSKGYTSRKGFYAGVFASVELNNYFSLQTELNFSPQGGQRNGLQTVPASFIKGITLPPGTNLYARFDNETIINYLEIPVLIQYTSATKLQYRILAGPYIAFRTSARTKTGGSSQLFVDEAGTIPLQLNGNPLPAVSFTSNTNIKDEIKTVNGGVQGGAAFLYELGPGSLIAEGRFIRGLINIQTNTEANGKNQTGSVVIALGYIFHFK